MKNPTRRIHTAFITLILSATLSACSVFDSSQYYSIGGTVSGLDGTVVLQNNGADNLKITKDGKFTFQEKVVDSLSYDVTVLEQPEGATCTVTDGTGDISNKDITNIKVECVSSTSVVAFTELFVSNAFDGSNQIMVYPIDATGDVAPLRVIAGASTHMSDPTAISISGDEIVVANYGGNTITVFPTSGDGNISPTREITGGSTNLNNPLGIFASATEIFVANQGGSITVYPISADGDVAPSREITGLVGPAGVTADDSFIYVADRDADAVKVFDISATGAAIPVRTISGASTLLNGPNAITISGNELFIGNFNGSGEILAFDKTADGDVAPNRTIAGATTTLNTTSNIAINNTDIFVGNESCSMGTSERVPVFQTSDDGDVAPTRVITGASTLLGTCPEGIALH